MMSKKKTEFPRFLIVALSSWSIVFSREANSRPRSRLKLLSNLEHELWKFRIACPSKEMALRRMEKHLSVTHWKLNLLYLMNRFLQKKTYKLIHLQTRSIMFTSYIARGQACLESFLSHKINLLKMFSSQSKCQSRIARLI